MGRTRKIKEKVVDISCGLLAGTTELFLFCLVQSFNVGKYGGRTSWAIERSIGDSIDEVASLGISKETVKKTIWNLTHKKFIKRKNGGKIEITKEGVKKLSELIPVYREKREWNSHLYLIIYDIKEIKKQERNILRSYLKKLGCGLLQNSVWLTPYNPKKILHDFIEEKNLAGSVIVSDIGKDGSIGEEKLDELIKRVYQLDKLNLRYKELIDLIEGKKLSKIQAEFQYLSILQDDPQLPLEILPGDWLGDRAFHLLYS